jgi:Dolichyl-phosphate-mannose-protein mannosyltransferase
LRKSFFKSGVQRLKARPPEALFFLLFSSWVFLIFINYFKNIPDPFGLLFPQLHFSRFGPAGWTQHLGVETESLAVIGLSFLAILNSWWLGAVLLEWLGLQKQKGFVPWAFEAGLGALLSSLFWMGTGLTRLWFTPLLAVLGLLALGPAFNKLKSRMGNFSLGRPPRETLLRVFVGVALFYGVLGYAQSLLPETFYDSMNYFLGIPQYWIFKHGITDDPGHILAGYFHGGTLYFLDGFYFGGTEAAKFLSFTAVVLGALFAGAWVKEEAGDKAGWAAFALTATFPLLFLNGWAARVDGLLTFCLLLFFYAARRFLKEPTPGLFKPWGFLAALLAGFAMTIKPTAAVAVAAVFLISLADLHRVWSKGFKLWMTLLAISLGLVAPWFLKNYFFTGNPFFPYGFSFMGGRSFFAPGHERLLYENRQFLALGMDLKNWIVFPWRLLMPGDGTAQFAGPLVLAFLPLCLPLFSKKGEPRFWAATALVYLGLGLCLSHMLRFVLPAFVLLLMAWAGWAAEKKGVWEKSIAGWGLAAALLGLPYFLGTSARYFDGFGVWTGSETRSQYLGRMVQNPYEDLVEWTDAHLPADARLLIAGDTRGLYYRRDFLANSAFDEPTLAQITRSSATPEAIAEKVNRLGVTDAVVNIPEGIRISEDYHLYELTPEEWGRLNRYLALYWKPLYFNQFRAVYAIEPSPKAGSLSALPRVNPFSFFALPAYDFSRAVQARNGPGALAAARAEAALFPGDPFWSRKVAWAKNAFSGPANH